MRICVVIFGILEDFYPAVACCNQDLASEILFNVYVHAGLCDPFLN